jgi:DNA-nicking Smr family endonuclease
MGKKSKAQGPFAALSGLKTPRKKALGANKIATATQAPLADEEDVAFFRQALRGVQPLPAPNRADALAPRRAPKPRFSGAEDVSDHSAALPKPVWAGLPLRPEEEARHALAAALADVRPLKQGANRVDLAQSRKAIRKETHGLAKHSGFLEPGLALSQAAHLDDEALFQVALASVQHLRPSDRVDTRHGLPPPEPRQFRADEHHALSQSLSEPFSLEDRLEMGEEASFLRDGLPRRVLVDLRRGRWVLQGEIDLHGLNRTQARDALTGFLAHSLREGRRCVRVIHGKGLGSPGKVAILKHLTRGWLAQREEILAFCQARPYDGGCGALLVLLKGQAV